MTEYWKKAAFNLSPAATAAISFVINFDEERSLSLSFVFVCAEKKSRGGILKHPMFVHNKFYIYILK